MTILWSTPKSFGTRMSEKGRSSYKCLVSSRLNMKLCAEQKTPQHSAPSIWELVGRMQAHTHSVLLGSEKGFEDAIGF